MIAGNDVRDESGSITVTSVGIILASTVFLALVLATGIFWVHKRHLQAQADAAALAAGRDLVFPCTDATVAKINARVAEYGDTLNPQVENSQPNVRLVVNKPQYYNQSQSDDTPDETPCESGMVDVKATETNLRSIMGVGIVPFINAHARVQLRPLTSFTGSIPIAVPDPTPKKVRAFFIDESDGSTIASANLSQTGTSGANAVWSSAGDTIPVNVGSTDRIGVRIALGGASSTTCGDPLVACFDYDSAAGADSSSSQKGLVFIRGYRVDPPVDRLTQAPKVQQAGLITTAPCPDASFSVGVACTVALAAKVDFGTGGTDPTTDPSVGGAKASLRAVANGANYPMTWSNGIWTTQQTIPVPAGGGPVPIQLEWGRLAGKLGTADCNTSGDPFKNNNPCHASLGTVQRSFSGNDVRSGPIQALQVSQGGQSVTSLRQCDSQYTQCTYALGVSLQIKGSLEIAKNTTDPPVALRIADQNQTQALDCDPAISNLEDELVAGCAPKYKPNIGTVCPNRSTLWSSAQPWSCIAIKTGSTTNAIPAGLNKRILGDRQATTCTNPNRWRVGFNIDTDPRVVQLVLTPFGSFNGTGNDSTVPVTGVGQFYITGWSGQGSGFNNPCETNDIPADPLLQDDPPGGGGFMVGHFIKYPAADGDFDPDEECDVDSLTPCIPVLTR